MKKLLITFALVAVACFAQAQFFIGGSFGMDFAKQNDNSEISFSFLPNGGYMFNENMGVGTEMGLTYTKNTEKLKDAEDVTKTFEFVFNPYFRYVVFKLDKFSFYADGKIDLKFGNMKSNDTSRSITTFGLGVVPGMAYNFTEHISMAASLNVLKFSFEHSTVGDSSRNEFGFGVNQPTPVTIGFFYTF